jgi:hypothetical protein
MTGATGGFFGGEAGVRQFVAQGKFNMADSATVRKRQTTKDISLLLGLVVLVAVGAYGLEQLGLVDFSIHGGASDMAGDLLESTNPTVAMPPAAAPVKIQPPAVSPEALKALMLVSGTVAGVTALFTVKEGTSALFWRAVKGAKRNTARVALLAAAGAVGFWLVQQ